VLLLGLVPGPALTAQQQDTAGPPARRGPWHVAVTPEASPADAASVAALITAALTIGQPERAAAALARYGDRLGPSDRLGLAGAIATAEGRWHVAAQAFGAAALLSPDTSRGVLDARAAQAFEHAERHDSARAAYGRARIRLPLVAGWLAVREARVTLDAAAADSLLASAAPEAWALALEVRAHHRLLAGDPAAAVSLLEAAGLSGEAAELAQARGDPAAALRLAGVAIGSADTADARRALVLLQEQLPPSTAVLALAAARGAARLRSPRRAVEWAERAVALGDSTPDTFLLLGAWLEEIGRRRDALTWYARAGEAGTVAHARTRLRLGDRGGAAVLRRYAADHPDSPAAPGALYTAAEALGSDSLLREVARRWPRDATGSRARMRLALRYLDHRDSARAEPLLEDEVAHGGPSATRARYLRARILQSRKDRSGAQAEFAVLAEEDALGYYGMLARQAAGLPAPVLPRPGPSRLDSAATHLLAQLTLLDSLGFEREADVLVRSLVTRDWSDAGVMLDAAEGLSRLGRANQAIRLGYRAARDLGLSHPRVLRAVFPWPERELIEAEAAAFGLDPYLVAGLIRQESWFLATARSRAGALGYMQLMPATAQEVARHLGLEWSDTFLTIGDANLHVGCAHLAGLLRRYPDDIPSALAAYNAGGTPVGRWRRRPGAADPAGFVEAIAYPETQEYVRAVVRNRELYRWLHGAGVP
jgi:soluble lytic murein transglycosylase